MKRADIFDFLEIGKEKVFSDTEEESNYGPTYVLMINTLPYLMYVAPDRPTTIARLDSSISTTLAVKGTYIVIVIW